jgi:hypothetical protein
MQICETKMKSLYLLVDIGSLGAAWLCALLTKVAEVPTPGGEACLGKRGPRNAIFNPHQKQPVAPRDWETRTCRRSERHFLRSRPESQQLFLSFALARGDGQVFQP